MEDFAKYETGYNTLTIKVPPCKAALEEHLRYLLDRQCYLQQKVRESEIAGAELDKVNERLAVVTKRYVAVCEEE